MHHPFELDLPALKAIASTLAQPLVDEEAETIQGGRHAVSQTLTAPRPPSESGEDGGGVMTTMAVGEEGGTYTTLALGEEGGDQSCFPTVNLPNLPAIALPSFPPF